jgi:hypothetical protein
VVFGQEVTLTANTVYMVGSVASGTAFLTIWITNQFSKLRRELYRVISRHNREDDDRFAELHDDIWQIHLRNANIDGSKPPIKKPFPRRRYLIESGEERGDDLSGTSR